MPSCLLTRTAPYRLRFSQLAALMPPGTNIPEAYSRGSDEDQAFVQNLAIFLTAFFRAHLGWVPACLPAHLRVSVGVWWAGV